MLSDKLTLLNEAVLSCLGEADEIKIAKMFAKVGLEVLEADFGLVWLNTSASPTLKLVYKSANIPFTPNEPRKDGHNHAVLKRGIPYYVSDINTKPGARHLSKYIKSFVIIPISYQKEVYGTIIFCFEKPEPFAREKKILCAFIGNSVAQATKTNRLIKTDIMLAEERKRTEFIANAMHELRTPLAIMRGYIDLALMNKGGLKAIPSTLKVVTREIDLLARILKDLELITTSSANYSENIIEFKPVDLSQTIKTIKIRLTPLAVKKNIRLHIKENKKAAYIIEGDKIYLEKLFLNLIKNSITYGKNNGKTIIELSEGKNNIIVKIMDDGIGIGKEDLPKIFERFYRADKAHSESRSGLGLSIAKWAAVVHGGKISVKSRKNKGSIFTVTMPIKHTKIK